jgi:hypothetical protein
VAERGLVGADLHAAAAEDIGGADENGVADAVGDRDGFLDGAGDAGPGRLRSSLVRSCVEAVAVLGEVDGEGCAEEGDAGEVKAVGEVEWGLAAELDDEAADGAAVGP